jgi:hypothetical protein
MNIILWDLSDLWYLINSLILLFWFILELCDKEMGHSLCFYTFTPLSLLYFYPQHADLHA